MKATRRQQTAGRIVGHSRAADNSSEFHGYFSSQFLQRYADLFQALAQPVQHVALLNAFADVDDCDQLGLESCYRSGVVSCLRFPQPVTSYPPPPQCPYTQLKQFYWLDFASVLPPLLLAVQPHHTVLDMCAAPGGKSLILAQQLLRASAPGQQEVEVHTGLALSVDLLQQLSFKVDQQQQEQHDSQQPEQLQQQQQQQQEQQNSQQPAQQQQQQQILRTSDSQGVSASDQDDAVSDSSHGTAEEPQEVVSSSAVAVVSRGRLVCNELDPVRRQRLSGVINSYLPGGLRRHVRVTSHDAVKYWSTFESEMYDRVLLDAPCTSERHVVAAACEAGGVVSASSWSLQHCEQLAALQLKLLLAGLRALKPGGRLVYSTCSMADMENDHVVLKALQQTAKSIMSKTHAGSCTVRAVPIDEWGLDQQLEDLVGADRTQYGLLVLPDKQGYGPIYLSMLEKCSA